MPGVPRVTRAPRHSTRHWGYHCRKMFTFALATFLLLFTVALCTVTLLGETRGPSHLCIFFPDLWPEKDGSQPKVKKWTKMPFLFSFCLHVLHSEEQSRKVSLPFIGKCHTVPLNFYFFPFLPPSPPNPYPQLASVFSCASQLVFLTFGS